MKKFVLALAAISFLASCNTIEGIGQDVASTGEVVAEAAKDVKEDMNDGK